MMTNEIMFRTIHVYGWNENDTAIIELWKKEGNIIKITMQEIPINEYRELFNLYREVKIRRIEN